MSWPWNSGQRSLKVIENGTVREIVYDFLLVFFSNFVPKCRDLENRVRDPSRSLEISPFDRAHTTSYWRSIVTMALSAQGVKKSQMTGLPDGRKSFKIGLVV